MARAEVAYNRPATAPAHRSGIGGWIVAAIVGLLIAAGAAYYVFAANGTRYSPPPSYTSAPAATAPANAPVPQVTGAPAPQMSAPAAPHYP
jgi:hypothetical protein